MRRTLALLGAIALLAPVAWPTSAADEEGKACKEKPRNPKKECPHVIGEGGAPDPLLHLQWGLHRIRAPDAWNVSTGDGVLIAVIDTGAVMDHPDLVGRLVVDPEADLVNPPGSRSQQDCNGHGTSMAGIAAANTNNGIGVAGTAPNALLLPIKFYCTVDDVENSTLATARGARAIRYAVAAGADVISMSWEVEAEHFLDPGSFQVLEEAIEEAWNSGVVMVAAAGNTRDAFCRYPARDPRVLCVGATDYEDQAAYYTATDVMGKAHVMAPSNGIEGHATARADPAMCARMITTTGPRPGFCNAGLPDGYSREGGTSSAAPSVAGIAALLVEQGLSNAEILERIRCTADDLGDPGRDPIFGYGRVNALRAVTDDRNPGC